MYSAAASSLRGPRQKHDKRQGAAVSHTRTHTHTLPSMTEAAVRLGIGEKMGMVLRCRPEKADAALHGPFKVILGKSPREKKTMEKPQSSLRTPEQSWTGCWWDCGWKKSLIVRSVRCQQGLWRHTDHMCHGFLAAEGLLSQCLESHPKLDDILLRLWA